MSITKEASSKMSNVTSVSVMPCINEISRVIVFVKSEEKNPFVVRLSVTCEETHVRSHHCIALYKDEDSSDIHHEAAKNYILLVLERELPKERKP